MHSFKTRNGTGNAPRTLRHRRQRQRYFRECMEHTGVMHGRRNRQQRWFVSVGRERRVRSAKVRFERRAVFLFCQPQLAFALPYCAVLAAFRLPEGKQRGKKREEDGRSGNVTSRPGSFASNITASTPGIPAVDRYGSAEVNGLIYIMADARYSWSLGSSRSEPRGTRDRLEHARRLRVTCEYLRRISHERQHSSLGK